MLINSIFSVVSDIIMVLDTIFLIVAFGVSKIKKKRYIFISVALNWILSTLILYSYYIDISFISVFIYPIMFLCAFKIIFGKINIKQIYIALSAELIVTLLSSCVTLIIFRVSGFSYDWSERMALAIVRVGILIFSCFIIKDGKFNSLNRTSKIIPKQVYGLIIIILLCIDLLAIFNNYPQVSVVKQNIVTGLIIIVTITLLIMIFSLLINVASKNYYTALSALLEKQVAAQIDHYEKLEKLNSDMRTFRHDYINHLNSINALIGEGCCSDAQDYIAKLTESTHRNEAVFLTGNRLADAILTDKSDSCKDHADIVFDGCITDKIDNSDICIILANALDNAAEACQKCAERSRITIASQIRQGYWAMTMKNPTVSADSEGLMKTSKKDERNHGFGLISIEQTVKKYDGTMAVSIKDGVFELSVVLKIPDNK